MARMPSVFLAWTVLTANLCAQDRPAESDSVRTVVVEQKSPLAAGLLEAFIFPTVGYAYAGNWSRGVPSALVRLVGVGLIISTVDIYANEQSCEGRCVAGVAVYLAATAWAIFDAVNTAERENEKRRAAAGVSVTPTLEEGRMGIRVRVAVRY